MTARDHLQNKKRKPSGHDPLVSWHQDELIHGKMPL
jgi:hypothetical protein